MLEHYFHRPATVDRLRALWLGPAVTNRDALAGPQEADDADETDTPDVA